MSGSKSVRGMASAYSFKTVQSLRLGAIKTAPPPAVTMSFSSMPIIVKTPNEPAFFKFSAESDAGTCADASKSSPTEETLSGR